MTSVKIIMAHVSSNADLHTICPLLTSSSENVADILDLLRGLLCMPNDSYELNLNEKAGLGCLLQTLTSALRYEHAGIEALLSEN